MEASSIMDQHNVPGRAKVLLALVSSAAFLVVGCAQPGAGGRQGPGSSTGSASTLTGGAEARPTDQATPGATGAGQGGGATTGSSATSGTGRASTLTGGSEAAPTDQSTPGAGGPGRAAPAGTGGAYPR